MKKIFYCNNLLQGTLTVHSRGRTSHEITSYEQLCTRIRIRIYKKLISILFALSRNVCGSYTCRVFFLFLLRTLRLKRHTHNFTVDEEAMLFQNQSIGLAQKTWRFSMSVKIVIKHILFFDTNYVLRSIAKFFMQYF